MAVISGQKAVTTAGTAVQLHASQRANGTLMVKALTANTGLVYLGNVNGTVSSANGMPLAAGEVVVLESVGSLADVWLDSAVNGEGVAWLILAV